MRGRVHVIGAGLAGLAAAVALVKAGRPVVVHEAAGHAGGRCRSFFDAATHRRIDNGNHLVLSGNGAIAQYLRDIGDTREGLAGPERAEFAFHDLASGGRWTVRPNRGMVPWWVFSPARRVPATEPHDYLKALRLARIGPAATVADCLDDGGAAYRRFWEPLAIAVLNADGAEGAASLLWPVLRETFARGEAACRPRMAATGLSECFIDPAVAFLAAAGAPVRYKQRLHRLALTPTRVEALEFSSGEAVTIAPGDAVVLAVPPASAAALIPGLSVPRASRAIVNGHFVLPGSANRPALLGLVGGMCHWLFVRGDVASVTISAADALCERPGQELATAMWTEVRTALNLGPAPMPAHRIVKEKRATFAQTPEEVARRPGTKTAWENLVLAGDWTDTGLPATLEGSVRSGNTAAKAVIAVQQALDIPVFSKHEPAVT